MYVYTLNARKTGKRETAAGRGRLADMDIDTATKVAYVRDGYGRGWSFTPLAGKRPTLKAWAAAERETEAAAVAWAAAGNVGLRTGTPSGVLVVDLDVGKADYDVAAVKALGFPPTITARTGGGGYHLYFRMPAGVHLGNSAAKLAPAVDTRGTGGQVVFPGSVHESGRPYAWRKGFAPADVDLAELPPAVVAALVGPAAADPPKTEDPPKVDPPRPAPPARRAAGGTGTRAERRRSAYAAQAIAGESAKVESAVEGTRNGTLNDAAFRLGQLIAGGVVDEADATAALGFAAAAAGLGSGEIAATIASGYTGGKKDPRGVPDRDDAPQAARLGGDRGGGDRDAAPPAAGDASPAKASGGPGTGSRPPGGGKGEGGRVGLGQVDPDSDRLVLSKSKTLPTAWAYVRAFHDHSEGRTVHSYAGRLLAWQANRYAELEDGAVRQRLAPWLHRAMQYVKAGGDWKLAGFDSNPTTVTAALETVRAFAHIDQGRDVPFWVSDDAAKPDPREVLPCVTGNLHIPSGAWTPATPDLFTFNALAFDYDAQADPPTRWLDFLAELWGDDAQAIGLLQQWFGYCLTADTSQQKMLLLIGPRRSGKGTIAKVLTELIGVHNVAGPTTSALAETFGMEDLLGKSLAIVSDARFSGPHIQTVVERLLCISGEDTLTIPQKYKSAATVRLPIRMMFLSNEVPRMRDAAGALAGRFLVLTLRESFYGREDPALVGRLLEELPGILLWALQGWISLHAAGRFLVPASSEESETLLMDLSSPVSAFVREECTREVGDRVTVAELYAAYCQWAEDAGHKFKPSRQGFGRELAAAIPGIRPRRNHRDGRFYEGIAVRGTLATPPGPGE